MSACRQKNVFSTWHFQLKFLAKFKFPTPGKPFHIKFPTPLAWKVVEWSGLYPGRREVGWVLNIQIDRCIIATNCKWEHYLYKKIMHIHFVFSLRRDFPTNDLDLHWYRPMCSFKGHWKHTVESWVKIQSQSIEPFFSFIVLALW